MRIKAKISQLIVFTQWNKYKIRLFQFYKEVKFQPSQLINYNQRLHNNISTVNSLGP